jgi:hypothetical protein
MSRALPAARHIPTVLLIGLLAACGSSPTAPDPAPTPAPAPQPAPNPSPAPQFVLSGEWERINSSFATLDGMVVRVSDDGAQATIVSTPSNPFQFAPGDLKWRNITRVSDTRFSFEDLLRQSGTGAMSYVSGFMEAQNNGTELAMTFPSTGTIQQWRRR